ncbi:ATP-binding cassette domain-containing protein [Streptacidiphilus monticola]
MSTATPPALAGLHGVSKRHGLVQALQDVHLELTAGETVALVGPPGAGKTALCRVLAGLDPVDSGQILVHGHPLPRRGRQRTRLRAAVALVGEPPELLPTRTLLENLTAGQMKLRGRTLLDAERRALAELRRVGLIGYAARRPPELTGDERLRTALARALALDPAVLLLDDPPTAVRDLLPELTRADRALVVVTREAELVRSEAHRVVFMSTGRIVEEGPAHQFLSAPARHAPATS